MDELLSVDHLDEADARSLAACLSDADVRAEVREAEGFSVRVAGGGAALALVLRAVEGWAATAGIASVCVRLDGRSYALEGRGTGNRRYAAETSR